MKVDIDLYFKFNNNLKYIFMLVQMLMLFYISIRSYSFNICDINENLDFFLKSWLILHINLVFKLDVVLNQNLEDDIEWW